MPVTLDAAGEADERRYPDSGEQVVQPGRNTLDPRDPTPNELVAERARPLRRAERDGTGTELPERRSQSLAALPEPGSAGEVRDKRTSSRPTGPP